MRNLIDILEFVSKDTILEKLDINKVNLDDENLHNIKNYETAINAFLKLYNYDENSPQANFNSKQFQMLYVKSTFNEAPKLIIHGPFVKALGVKLTDDMLDCLDIPTTTLCYVKLEPLYYDYCSGVGVEFYKTLKMIYQIAMTGKSDVIL